MPGREGTGHRRLCARAAPQCNTTGRGYLRRGGGEAPAISRHADVGAQGMQLQCGSGPPRWNLHYFKYLPLLRFLHLLQVLAYCAPSAMY